MPAVPDSLRVWLREQITQSLNRTYGVRSFVLWCDPECSWRELLMAAGEGATFDVWAEEVGVTLKDYHFDDPAQALRAYELLLRQRLHQAPPRQRVIWLPIAREAITYLKVFELQAADVKEISLPEALATYGMVAPGQLVSARRYTVD